jgi:hypothetical protein
VLLPAALETVQITESSLLTSVSSLPTFILLQREAIADAEHNIHS